jgi:enamine deaminase RidA (YjgF/YER057c/UK114 family)
MRFLWILALCLGLAPLVGDATAQNAGERCPRAPLPPLGNGNGDGAGGARHLNPPGLMDSSRFFSQVVVASHGTTVHVAGQTGYRVDRSIAHTKEGQMAQAFENVKIALEAAHARTDQVVMVNVYIVGYTEADLEELAHCTAAYFPPDRLPASTLVPVPRLARNELLFEIDVTAVIPAP